MRYVGDIYRPPSEADSLILQATIGCSWNACTYCEMYGDKTFSVRNITDILEDIETAGRSFGKNVRRIFVADGDPLAMDVSTWEKILKACQQTFPNLIRVSTYATAMNLLEKSEEDLKRLRALGLRLLYIGPETGDDPTFKTIAKGANFKDHVQAAQKAHKADMNLSTIFLLGVGGEERSQEHARGTAKLITEMDPKYFSLLTLTLIPGSPIAKLAHKGRFTLPSVEGLLREMETVIREANPRNSVFRTNHASNYLPLQGRLPRDREKLLQILDKALSGQIPLRPEWSRGL